MVVDFVEVTGSDFFLGFLARRGQSENSFPCGSSTLPDWEGPHLTGPVAIGTPRPVGSNARNGK